MTFHSTADPAAVSVCDPEALHRDLAHWNRRRMAPCAPHASWAEELREEHRMRWLEGVWMENLRAEAQGLAANAPTDVDGFVAWFENLITAGPGQNDPLFDWLEHEASLGQMAWFLTQEAAGEAGFDDLTALTQVKLPTSAKLELARNYWDEMGRGGEAGMHGPMLERTMQALSLTPTIDGTVWESLALANTMTAMATTRRYAWHSVGALGVIELTAPTRVGKVAEGLKRLGCPPAARKYFHLHAVLDLKHAADWIENALRPLVTEDPTRATFIAEGAVMRLLCGKRCFDAYRAHLWAPAMAMAAE